MSQNLRESSAFHACSSIFPLTCVKVMTQWLRAAAAFQGGDSMSVNSAIRAFEKGHRWQQAIRATAATVLGEPDIFRCCALITACRRGALAAFFGDPGWPGTQFISKLWNELRLSHLKKLRLGNGISNHSKMQRLHTGSGMQWEGALHEFYRLSIHLVAHVMNTVAFSAAISACETCGQWMQAMHLFEAGPWIL